MTADLVRFFVLLAIFASVVLVLHVVLRTTVEGRVYASAVNKRLKFIARGFDREDVWFRLRRNDPALMEQGTGLLAIALRHIRHNLMMAGVPFGPTQVMLGMAVIFAVLVLITSMAAFVWNYQINGGVLLIIVAFAAALAIALPLLVLSFLAQRMRRRMQEQFPVALDVFVRALRSGHPVAAAIELLTQEMEDPIGSEFGVVADEISYGAELTEVLHAMAERWDLDDIRMFVVSLSVQNETGGNLAEILDNLSKVIRERAALYLKVRALSSEGRLTGWLLTILPVFTFVSLFMINAGFYLEVAQDPIFLISFPGLLILYGLGVFLIRRIVNLEV